MNKKWVCVELIIVFTFISSVLTLVNGANWLDLEIEGTTQEKNIDTYVENTVVSMEEGKITEKTLSEDGKSIFNINGEELIVTPDTYAAYSVKDSVKYCRGITTVPAADENEGADTTLVVTRALDDDKDAAKTVKKMLKNKVEAQVKLNKKNLLSKRRGDFKLCFFITSTLAFILLAIWLMLQ